MAHDIVKPEKLVSTAVQLLGKQLTLPKLFVTKTIDEYKGAKDDTINLKVPGVLPYRTYGWRNDRSQSLVFDTYKERSIAMQFGGDAYSAVAITDEQATMDFAGWTDLAAVQTRAIGKGLNAEASDYLRNADYAITLGVPVYAPRWALVSARAALAKINAPDGRRYFVCGSDWESAFLLDDKLALASNVGDGIASDLLTSATIGNRYGFQIIVAPELDPGEAYAFSGSAFAFLNAAPALPGSVPFGALSKADGIALRWIRDYETAKQQDRSVFTTYKGFQQVKDVLVKFGSDRNETVGDYEHMVRGVKLVLVGTKALATAATVVPQANSGTTEAEKMANEFATFTGYTAPVIPAS